MNMEPIIKEILDSPPDKIKYAKRLIVVSDELMPILTHMSFCQSGSFISKGKIYNIDVMLVLIYEFYLLSVKFSSLSIEKLELFLQFHAERIKELAAEGRMDHLFDLMN